MKIQREGLFGRVGIYILGLFVLTFGQRLFVKSGYGAASLDALCVGLSERFGLTAGTWVGITAIVMILISAVLNKRRPDVGGLITSYLFGVFFDFWGNLFEVMFVWDYTIVRIAMYCMGILCGPLGTALYFQSGFSKSALDGFIWSVKDAFSLSVRGAKTSVEAVTIVLGLLVGGPIGIATILTGILYGPFLQMILLIMGKHRIKKQTRKEVSG